MRGRVRRASRRGVTSVAPGDLVVTLFSPQCRSACTASAPTRTCAWHPRAAEPGLPARRHHAAVARRRADPPLHGHIDVRRVHGDAGDRARQGLTRGRPDHACLFACGCSTGLGARCSRPRSSPARPASCSAPAWSASGVAGCRLQGAERIICVDMSQDRLELARGRARPTPGPATRSSSACSTRPAASAPTTRSRRPAWSRSCARRSRPRGWAGACARSRGRRTGETLDVVPRLLITGRRVCGSSFGGVKGRDQVPQLCSSISTASSTSEPFLSHSITLDEVNRGFDLMHHQDGIRSVIALP